MKTIRFSLILWLLGMAGVFSLLGIGLPSGVTTDLPLSLWEIKALVLIQPTILLSLAVVVGTTLAEKVGLEAPLIRAIANRNPWQPALVPQLLPGLLGGLLGGLLLTLVQWAAIWILPSAFISRAQALGSHTAVISRLLYGGVTEEILLRWGLMTLLAWGIWRLFGRHQLRPGAGVFVGAIVISAVLFGWGHVPLALTLGVPITPVVLAYLILGNAMFGLIAGVLYWRSGLESAMIAHMIAHLVMLIAVG